MNNFCVLPPQKKEVTKMKQGFNAILLKIALAVLIVGLLQTSALKIVLGLSLIAVFVFQETKN